MNRVKELRRERGMTQSAFAEFCDVSILSVSRFEHGASPSVESARKIAEACGVSMDYLLNRASSAPGLREPEEEEKLILAPWEADLIADARELSDQGRELLQETITELRRSHPRLRSSPGDTRDQASESSPSYLRPRTKKQGT